ncbi:MAG: hypothetical protein OEV03_07895, partial [Gammaproteobacteria bacterium]|nr:hypothetical protein [Gammaproteobacteria bacterium]
LSSIRTPCRGAARVARRCQWQQRQNATSDRRRPHKHNGDPLLLNVWARRFSAHRSQIEG